MPTLRTLFSGGELFGVGAQQAGYTHADGYELEPKIAAVAQLNGFDVRVADVCAVDYAALPTVNHLHASPSCKNASNANQKGVDENGDPLPRETEQDLACADAVCRAIAAHQGKRTLLIDIDPQCNASRYLLGQAAGELAPTVAVKSVTSGRVRR